MAAEKNLTPSPEDSKEAPSAAQPRALVISDICDTLYGVNTTTDFLRYASAELGTIHRLATPLLTNRRSPLIYALAIAGRAFHKDLGRDLLLRLLRGIPRQRLETLATTWVRQELPEKAHRKVHAFLEEERVRGSEIILASASIDVVVNAIADTLEIEAVSSILETDDEGLLTGRLSQDAKGSKDRLLSGPIDSAEHLTVITDNESDLALLRCADRRVIVLRKGDASRAFWDLHLKDLDFEFLPSASSCR